MSVQRLPGALSRGESTGTLQDDPPSTRTRYIPSSDRSAVPTIERRVNRLSLVRVVDRWDALNSAVVVRSFVHSHGALAIANR